MRSKHLDRMVRVDMNEHPYVAKARARARRARRAETRRVYSLEFAREMARLNAQEAHRTKMDNTQKLICENIREERYLGCCEDKDKCICRGTGWWLTNYDTWERCAVHPAGPHPEDYCPTEEEMGLEGDHDQNP